MCAAYNWLNKACTHKRNLLRCLCTYCRKQIELLNVVVKYCKDTSLWKGIPHNHKPEQNTLQETIFMLFSILAWFSFLPKSFIQPEENYHPVINFEAQAHRQAGD